MGYFPINMNVTGRRAVIVGGGAVAARKCAALVEAGAAVHVVAPELVATLAEYKESGIISVDLREYRHGDLTGAFLAFAATDSEKINAAVAAEARSLSIHVNVASAPDAGTFEMPASIRKGDLLIAISTGGRCPSFAAEIREMLDQQFGPEYGAAVALLGAVREKLLTEKEPNAYNKRLLRVLAGHNLPFLLKNDAFAEIDRLLLELLGPGFSLAELGVKEKDSE